MSSVRLNALENMKTRYPWEKRWKQLNQQEVKIIYDFIKDNDHLTKGEFEHKATRMFLGQENKPKRWTLIDEILVNCNSHMK